MGDIPAFHATNRLGGGFRGALRRRVHSSVGLHGVEVQTAGNAIALRSSEKMTIGKGGWVEGCITVPLA